MRIHRILIVGNPEEHHVGSHFLQASRQLELESRLADVRELHSRNIWVNRLFLRLARRPVHLGRFTRQILAICREYKPQLLLVTGISPPDATALVEIGCMKIRRANYLTDDPWNPANRVRFFWLALRSYDVVFSPRRANLGDLQQHGCQRVEYLPFAYDPAVHFPEKPLTAEERKRFACEVAFVGGADVDRLPMARALVRAGVNVKLYGGYWNRDAELRPYWHGFVHGREFRLAVCGAKVNLCMGRKANRDGHAMRSLELPAMRSCMVVEDTLEHHEIFGEEGECVEYFSSLEGMVAKVQALCARPDSADKLSQQAFQRICCDSRHTYADRLAHLCEVCTGLAPL